MARFDTGKFEVKSFDDVRLTALVRLTASGKFFATNKKFRGVEWWLSISFSAGFRNGRPRIAEFSVSDGHETYGSLVDAALTRSERNFRGYSTTLFRFAIVE